MTGLTEMSLEAAPRRFTLCVVHPRHEDAVIVGWGMALAEKLVVYLPAGGLVEGRSRLLCLSPEGATWQRLFHHPDFRIIWIDPESEY